MSNTEDNVPEINIDNPQRSLANNSVAYTEKPKIEIFIEEWLSLVKSKSGERGIINGADEVFGISLEDGKTYKFTGLKLKTGEWKRVDELTEGDDIESF